MSTGGRKWIAVGLVAVAVIFIVIGVIYLTVPAHDLPSFIPGKPAYGLAKAARNRNYTKRGIAMFILAAGTLFGAWFVSPLRSRPAASEQA